MLTIRNLFFFGISEKIIFFLKICDIICVQISSKDKTSALVSSVFTVTSLRVSSSSASSHQLRHLWFMRAWYSLWWENSCRNTLYFLS